MSALLDRAIHRAMADEKPAEMCAWPCLWWKPAYCGAYTDRAAAYPMFWPGYLPAKPVEFDRPTLPVPALAPPKCECGADKAGCGGGGAHSDWCPKAPRP